jgi:Tfp pilus assembly protein PilO
MRVIKQLLHRRAVVVLTATIVLAVPLWWFAWMAPAGSKVAAENSARSAAQAQRALLLERLDELRADRAEASAARRYLARFAAAVPATPDAPGLVVQVYKLASEDGVKLMSITDDTEVAASGYSTIPVSLEVIGGRNNLVAFVDGLYGISRLLTIDALSFSGSGDVNRSSGATMTASVSATAYTLAAPTLRGEGS